MPVPVTDPAIVQSIIAKLKAEESLQSLVGDRVFDAEPETLPGGPYLVVTADRTTPPKHKRTLQQSLVNVMTVAANEATKGVILVAVQHALSGRVFDPVSTCVLHDTGPDKVTTAGWHRRTDLFAAFHAPLDEPNADLSTELVQSPAADKDARIAELEQELAAHKATTTANKPADVEQPAATHSGPLRPTGPLSDITPASRRDDLWP